MNGAKRVATLLMVVRMMVRPRRNVISARGPKLAMVLLVASACAGLSNGTTSPASSALPSGAVKALAVSPYSTSDGVIAFGSLWLPGGSGPLYRIDVQSNRLTTIPIGDVAKVPSRLREAPRVPSAVTAGFGSVWAARPDNQSLARIDPATNKVIGDIPLPAEPFQVCSGSSSIWVTSLDDAALIRIDPVTNRAVGTWALGSLAGCAEADGVLWLANSGVRQLIKFDIASDRVVATAQLPGSPVFVATASNYVWVEEKNPIQIQQIRPADLAIRASIPGTADSGGPLLYSAQALWAGTLRIDPETAKYSNLTWLGTQWIAAVGSGWLWARELGGQYLYRYAIPG